MTPATKSGSGSGKISISSCLKCQKVFSVVELLSKSMQEFEVFTMEMEFDVESARSKSEKVLSNFWQLISTIKSFKILEKDLCQNPIPTASSSCLGDTVEKRGVESHNLENDNKNKSATSKSTSKSESESNRAHKMPKLKRQQEPESNSELKPNPFPYMTAKRLAEINKSRALLRTIKCETPKGFYNLFECVKCHRQFNNGNNGIRHIQIQHLGLGTRCKNCKNPFFDKKTLNLHISKCSKSSKQFEQIKVWLRNDMKKPATVQLQSHQKGKAKQKQNKVRVTRNPTRGRKNQNHDAKKEGQNRGFDLTRLKVRNPYPNFSIVKAMNVKVVIERLEMKKSGEISSKLQTEIQTTEKIEVETGKETNSSETAENESCVAVLRCKET